MEFISILRIVSSKCDHPVICPEGVMLMYVVITTTIGSNSLS